MTHINLVLATRRQKALRLAIEGVCPRTGELTLKYGWLRKMPKRSIASPGRYVVIAFSQVVEEWRKRIDQT